MSLLPNPSTLLTAHNLQIASVILAFATIALSLLYGRRGCDGGSGGDSFSSDCGDADGGSCD